MGEHLRLGGHVEPLRKHTSLFPPQKMYFCRIFYYVSLKLHESPGRITVHSFGYQNLPSGILWKDQKQWFHFFFNAPKKSKEKDFAYKIFKEH